MSDKRLLTAQAVIFFFLNFCSILSEPVVCNVSEFPQLFASMSEGSNYI